MRSKATSTTQAITGGRRSITLPFDLRYWSGTARISVWRVDRSEDAQRRSGTLRGVDRLSRSERTTSGFTLWNADPPEESRICHGGDLDACDRHRRQYRDFQFCERRIVKAIAVWRAGENRPGAGETARRGPKRHLDAQLPRLAKRQHCL